MDPSLLAFLVSFLAGGAGGAGGAWLMLKRNASGAIETVVTAPVDSPAAQEAQKLAPTPRALPVRRAMRTCKFQVSDGVLCGNPVLYRSADGRELCAKHKVA